MALRTIRTIGDSILTKKCKEVKEMTPRLQTLVDDMLETMYAEGGVGLAAPQVGILKRIVVIDVDDAPIILINPVITETSGLLQTLDRNHEGQPAVNHQFPLPIGIQEAGPTDSCPGQLHRILGRIQPGIKHPDLPGRPAVPLVKGCRRNPGRFPGILAGRAGLASCLLVRPGRIGLAG